MLKIGLYDVWLVQNSRLTRLQSFRLENRTVFSSKKTLLIRINRFDSNSDGYSVCVCVFFFVKYAEKHFHLGFYGTSFVLGNFSRNEE